ncbi:MAG: hypothetical protein AAF729_11490 [Pseudomonadota bacterium]
MRLAECIAAASAHERDDLAAFLAAEFEMQSLDVTTREMTGLDPKEISKAMAAWAFMKTNEKDID